MKHLIAISQHEVEADFILRNAMIADVFLLQWKKADLVVADGRIIAVDTEGIYQAKHEEDANCRRW